MWPKSHALISHQNLPPLKLLFSNTSSIDGMQKLWPNFFFKDFLKSKDKKILKKEMGRDFIVMHIRTRPKIWNL